MVRAKCLLAPRSLCPIKLNKSQCKRSFFKGLIGCPDGALARPVGCKGPLIGCLVGVCSLAGGMQSERAGLAPEIRKFRPFLQSLAAVMRVECVGGLP